jgi:hypothetical protein
VRAVRAVRAVRGVRAVRAAGGGGGQWRYIGRRVIAMPSAVDRRGVRDGGGIRVEKIGRIVLCFVHADMESDPTDTLRTPAQNRTARPPVEDKSDPASSADRVPTTPVPNLLNSQGCRQTAADKESWHIL